MSFLTDEELDALRAIADRLRDQDGDEVCYGFFPGGNPNDFCPDPDCCSDEEVAAWKTACARYDETLANEQRQLCGLMERFTKTRNVDSFGMGTYTLRRTDVDELANELDRWLDKVREVEGRYL